MSEKFNPEALAERHDEAGAPPEDVRDGVQPVDDIMILDRVLDTNELPQFSAGAFTSWANDNWFHFVSDEEDWTNAEVLESLLHEWCGGRVKPKGSTS